MATKKSTTVVEPEGRELLKKLSAPFHPLYITARAGATNRDKTKTMAMFFADMRAYQKRLDEVCGTRWSVRYTPWGDRIICELTIDGETRSSTGEYGKQSAQQENGGTSAEAQAFKRAAAMWGLGRYLYELPKVWVEYNDGNKKITDQGMNRVKTIVGTHYNKWVQENGSPDLDEVVEQEEIGYDDEPAPTTNEPTPPSAAAQELIDEVYALAQQYKNGDHDGWLRTQVDRISNGMTENVEDLSIGDLERIAKGIQTLLDKRAKEESDPKA